MRSTIADDPQIAPLAPHGGLGKAIDNTVSVGDG